MSTVFFLGAGASVEAGYPLASNLIDQLNKTYKQNSGQGYYVAWKKFNTFMKRSRSPFIKLILNSDNPELFLTFPDLLEEAYEPLLHQQHIKNYKESLLIDPLDKSQIKKHVQKCIANDIQQKYTLVSQAKESFLQALDSFFTYKHCDDSGNPKKYEYLNKAFSGLKIGDAVITTNWDTLAERALLDLELWYPSDGYNFVRKLIEYKHHPRHKNKTDILLPPSKIKVLKLHGSIGWHDSGNKIYLRTPSFLQYFPIFSKTLTLADPDCPNIGPPAKPALILPSYIKQIKSPIIQNIWIEADKHLKKAKKIIIVGYSLPEADIGIRVLLNPLRKRLLDGDVYITCILGTKNDRSIRTLNSWKSFLGQNMEFIFDSAKNYFNSQS